MVLASTYSISLGRQAGRQVGWLVGGQAGKWRMGRVGQAAKQGLHALEIVCTKREVAFLSRAQKRIGTTAPLIL